MRSLPNRNSNIDALRGIAFLAVILINLLTEFRVPLLVSLEKFHTETGMLNHATDWIVGLTLDRKGFTVLSFLFGVGIAMMAQRNPGRFYTILFRRFSFLFCLGIVHMFFVFSGDILTLYSILGLIMIPLINLSSAALTSVIAICIALRTLLPSPSAPTGVGSADLIRGAYQIYGEGNLSQIFHFRLFEIKHLIVPLLIGVWPRTLVAMLLGVLAWKRGWLSNLQNSSKSKHIAFLSFMIGTACTGAEAYVANSGINIGRWNTILGDMGVFGLALSYSMFVLKLDSSGSTVRWFAPLDEWV